MSDVVLAEAAWALKAAFQQDQLAPSIAVPKRLEEAAFAFEVREALAPALGLFEAGPCGYAACRVAARHARHGCNFTAAFDRGMRKLSGVKVL